MEQLFEQGVTLLTGPQGGTLAIGVMIGWLLCTNTILKDTKQRLNKLEDELALTRSSFTQQINELRDKYEEELRQPSVPAHLIPNHIHEQ